MDIYGWGWGEDTIQLTKSSSPSLLNDFNMKVCLDFVKDFLCVFWDDHASFAFHSTNMIFYTD